MILIINEVSGPEKSIKHLSKNEAKMGMALGIDFWWIFNDFGRQVGAKLALKIDQESIQKGINKNEGKKTFQEVPERDSLNFQGFGWGERMGAGRQMQVFWDPLYDNYHRSAMNGRQQITDPQWPADSRLQNTPTRHARSRIYFHIYIYI